VILSWLSCDLDHLKLGDLNSQQVALVTPYPMFRSPKNKIMNFKSIFRLATAGLLSVAGVSLFNTAPTMAQSAGSFECKQDGYYVTVAVKNNGAISDPLIVWKTEEFSDAGYTPEVRCEEVTSRLNSAVERNGGSLNGLYLTAGRVNGLPVLCTVNDAKGGCNNNNLLFTLKRGNDPNAVLQRLFAATGSGTPIQQSGGQSYVDLNKLVQQLF